MQITLQELNMTYPNGKKALQGVSASLDSPSLIGLLGPNGAGKSTLMKLLVAGLLPTGGAIRADGEPLTKCERAYKARLGYLPQDFGLFDELTVEQFLDYMGALKGLRSGRESIRAVIEAVHLGEKRRARIRTLSGGQRQRVGIAQALLGDPAFLIFDEPTVGLDPEERIHFRNLFSRLAQDRLVLLSTHIIEEAASVFENVIILDQGRILENCPAEELVAQFHYISGREDQVEQVCRGLQVLSVQQMGRRRTAAVRGDPVKLREALEADVDVVPMNLQKVFVALCGHEPGEEGSPS